MPIDPKTADLMITDFGAWENTLDEAQRQSLENTFRFEPDRVAAQKRFASVANVAAYTGQDVEEVSSRFEDYYMHAFARDEERGLALAGGVKDANEFYGLLTKRAKNNTIKAETLKSASSAAFDSALRGGSDMADFAAWQVENEHLPEAFGEARKVWAKTRADVEKELGPDGRAAASRAFRAMRSITGASQESDAWINEAKSDLINLRVRSPKAYKLALAAVQLMAADAGKVEKGVAQGMGENAGRVISDIGASFLFARPIVEMSQDASEAMVKAGITNAENPEKLAAQIRARREVENDIRDMSRGVIDPVKSEREGWTGWAESAAYMGSTSLPYMASVLIPGGTAAAAGTFTSDSYNEFRSNGWEGADAAAVAVTSGVLQAAVERASEAVIKIPGVAGVLNKFGVKPGSSWVTQFLLRSGMRAGVEAGEEVIQEAMTPLLQELAHEINTSIPDTPEGKHLSDVMGRFFEADNFVPLLLSVIPLGMIGAGMSTSRDMDVMEEARHFFGDKVAADIMAEPDTAKRDAMIQEKFKAMPAEEFVKKARTRMGVVTEEAKQAAELLQKAIEDGILPRARKAERGADGWIVEDTQTGDVVRVASRDEAMSLVFGHLDDQEQRRAQAAAQLWDELYEKGGMGDEALRAESASMDTQKQAARSPEDAARVARAIETYAQLHGIPLDEARKIVFTVNGFNRDEQIENVRTAVSSVFGRGMNVATVLHETTHGRWRAGLESRRFTHGQGLAWVRLAEQATGIDFLPSKDDAQISEELLDEAIVDVTVADAIGRRKNGGKFSAGLISRGMAAMARGERNSMLGKDIDSRKASRAAGTFATWLKAWKEFWGQVIQKGKALRKAKAEGKLGDDYDAFLDELMEASPQRRHEAAAAKEALEIAQEGNMPFSLGYLGNVQDSGNVQLKSVDLARGTHESEGLDQGSEGMGTFRYRNDNETVYWHLPPGELRKESAAAALERKGFNVKRHIVMVYGSESALLAHGLAREVARSAFSLAPKEQDAEYLAAVESGDLAKAQSMADESAKAAGINPDESKVSLSQYKWAYLKGLSHRGTDTYWSFHTPSLTQAYNSGRAQRYKSWDGWKPEKIVSGWRHGNLPDGGVSRNHAENIAEPGLSLMALVGGERTPTLAAVSHRKVVYAYGWLLPETGSDNEPTIWPSGISNLDQGDIPKATHDPVVYNESGQVIPLSQRFNPETPDIRFSLAPRSLPEVADTILAAQMKKPAFFEAFVTLARRKMEKLWKQVNMRARPSYVDQSAEIQAEIESARVDYEADVAQLRQDRDFELAGARQEKSGKLTQEQIRRDFDGRIAQRQKEWTRQKSELDAKLAANDAAIDKDAARAEKERQMMALRTLDAILSAFPPEIRAKVGGFVKLASFSTDAAREKEITRRLAKLEEVIEEEAKKHYAAKIGKMLDRYKSQKDNSGRISGKLISTATEQVDYAAQIADLDVAAQAEKGDALESLIEKSDDADVVQDALNKLGILRMFETMDLKDSLALESAADWLETTIADGKLGKKIVDEARKEFVDDMREQAQAQVLDGKALNIDDANNLTNVNRAPMLAMVQRLRGMMSEALWTTAQRLEIIFGEGSKASEYFAGMAVAAANKSNDIKRAVSAQQREILGVIFGSDSKFTHAKGIAKLQKPRWSGVMVRRPVTKDVTLDMETLTKLADGTMTPETAGIREDELETAMEEWAASDRKRSVTITQVVNVGTETDRFMSELQGIQWRLWWNQADSKKQMERDGWSDESIKQLDAFLSDEAKALGMWISDSYSEAAKMIDPVYRRLFNAPLPRIKGYAPIYRMTLSTSADVMDLGNSDMNSGLAAGFTKSRVNTTAPLLEIDALAAFLSHWENVSHWVSHAELMRDMKAILLDKNVSTAIRQKKGDGALSRLKKDISSIETNGTKGAAEIASISKGWSWLMQYRAFKALSFRVSPIAKQTAAALNPLLADVPAHNYAAGLSRAFTSPQEFAADVAAMWKSDVVQRRIDGGFSAEARIAQQGASMTGSQAIVFMQAGMLPMAHVDAGWTAMGAAVAFDYYKRSFLSQNAGATAEMADAHATARLERMMATSAQPADIVNRSLIERSGNIFARSMSMFVSEQRKALAIEALAIRKLATGKSKNKALDVQRILVAHFVQSAITQCVAMFLASTLGDDEDEDREWSVKQWALSLSLGPISGLFLVGRGIESIARRMLGLRIFPNNDLAGKAADDLIRGTKSMDELFNPDDAEDVMTSLDALSAAAGSVGSGLFGPAAGAVDVSANLAREAIKITKALSDEE